MRTPLFPLTLTLLPAYLREEVPAKKFSKIPWCSPSESLGRYRRDSCSASGYSTRRVGRPFSPMTCWRRIPSASASLSACRVATATTLFPGPAEIRMVPARFSTAKGPLRSAESSRRTVRVASPAARGGASSAIATRARGRTIRCRHMVFSSALRFHTILRREPGESSRDRTLGKGPQSRDGWMACVTMR